MIRSDSPLPQSAKPFLTVQPDTGWLPVDWHELWRFRDLLLTLAQRDVKLRYRQTALGALWVVLQPLLSAAILSFVFNAVAGLSTQGVPPFLWAFVGMVGFTVFSSTLNKASISLVQNAGMISKVFFPRLLLPLSTTLSTLLDCVVSLAIVAVLMVIYRIAPGPQLLLLPLWAGLLLLMALGCGLFCAALTVSYRDVQYVLPVATSLLTLGSPIAYTVSVVTTRLPENLQPYYFVINPLASLLEAFRWSLLGRGVVPWPFVGYSAVVAVLFFIVGAMTFRRMEARFADVI